MSRIILSQPDTWFVACSNDIKLPHETDLDEVVAWAIYGEEGERKSMSPMICSTSGIQEASDIFDGVCLFRRLPSGEIVQASSCGTKTVNWNPVWR